MNRIINPYNVLAFYTEDNTEETKCCPILSPSDRLPAWQVKLSSFSGYQMHVVNMATGEETRVDTGFQSKVLASTDIYLTHIGTEHGKSFASGLYYIRLTIDLTTRYFSHVICMDSRLNYVPINLSLLSCANTSGDIYAFTFAFDSVFGEAGHEIFGKTADTWSRLGSTSGIQNITSQASGGTDTFYIRGDLHLGDITFQRTYEITYLTTDPCSSGYQSMSGIYYGGTGLDDVGYVEFSNTYDLENLNLLYQQSYVQRFYFERDDDFAGAVTEETFIRNGEGDQVLESATIAEQINIETYPVPDYLTPVLTAVRYHDTITLNSIVEPDSISVDNFQYSPREVENLECLVGTMSMETNRAHIGCQSNVS